MKTLAEENTKIMAEKDAPSAKETIKRIPPNLVRMMSAGDLIMVKSSDPKYSGYFRKFEALFETLANMEKVERLLNYKFFIGLIITSHAKKLLDKEKKRKLFDLKNDLFVHIANKEEYRKKLAFLYLSSPKPRVLEFCADCTKRNTEAATPIHNWEHCDNCKVDTKFYNLLSMHHKFQQGSVTLFLSQDQLGRIKGNQNPKQGNRSDFEEEGIFQKYHYTVKNLDSINLDDALKVHDRLIKL